MEEGLIRIGPDRGKWFSGISAQILALGLVPLVVLIGVLLLAVGIQSNEARRFGQVQVSTKIVAQSDRLYDILDSESQAIQRYDKTRSAIDDRRIARFSAQMRPAVDTLGNLVEASGEKVPLYPRYRQLTLAVSHILDVYHGIQVRRGHDAALKYTSAPAVMATLRAWRDVKTAFDRFETSSAIRSYAQSRMEVLPYQHVALGLAIIGVIATFAIFALFGMRIVQRLRRVAFNARELSRGGDPVPVAGDDEIGRLDKFYRALTSQLRSTIEEKEEAVNAYRRERRVASTLQRALLPQSFPHLSGLHIHTAYVGAENEVAVGGDWYDLFEIDDNLVGISVGDVAGHGMVAATLMAAVRQSVRSAARASSDPAVVLDHVNRVLCADQENALVSAIFATFDLRSGTLRYAIAGHPAPIAITPSLRASVVPGDAGVLLGIDRTARFETFEQQVEPGSSMVFYSDGLIEHERTPVQGVEQLLAASEEEARSPGSNPADGLQNRVLRGRPPHDDSAVMYLVYSQAAVDQAAWRRTWSFDARDEDAATRVKRAMFWQLVDHVDPADSLNVEIVYGELIANVSRHTPGEATVEVERRDAEILLSVSDRGEPFDATVPDAVDFLSESGRGMLLVASLSSSFEVTRCGEGNRVTAVFPAISNRSRLMVPRVVLPAASAS